MLYDVCSRGDPVLGSLRRGVVRTETLVRTCDFRKRDIVQTRPGALDDCDSVLRHDLSVRRADDYRTFRPAGHHRNYSACMNAKAKTNGAKAQCARRRRIRRETPNRNPSARAKTARGSAHETTIPRKRVPTRSSLMSPRRASFLPEQRRGSQWSKS